MFERILFATDLSPVSNGSVVPYVLEFASRYRSKVVAIHVKTGEWGDLQEREATLLDEQLANIPHEVAIAEGNVQDRLLGFADQNDIDLIVAGTHGRTGLGGILLGSVAEGILRAASCPVLTVGPQAWHSQSWKPAITEVVYATDLTPTSEVAGTYAVSLAQTFQSRLTMLNVRPQRHVDPVAESHEITWILRQMQESAAKEPISASQPYLLVEAGNPAEKILDVAGNYGAGLIVMGARPYPVGRATYLVRPTVHRVIVSAACPVLTVGHWRKRVHEDARSEETSVQDDPAPELCGI